MKKKSIQIIAGLVTAGFSLALIDAMLLEKLFFKVKSFDIGNTGSEKKVRLLLLSDLHFKNTFWPYYKKLAKKVNELQPDLIMITGDILDSSGKTGLMDTFLSMLGQNIPKVAIPGNHDHKAEASLCTLKKIYRKHHCSFLLNESTSFRLKGSRLTISGLDDFIEGCQNLEAAVADLGKEAHHLLLVHSPLQQELAKKEIDRLNKQRSADRKLNISYIFAGHNHGGQLTILGYPPKLPVKSGNYVKGWYNSEKPYLYVSKGFGTTTVPFRFGARSEVTLFNYFV